MRELRSYRENEDFLTRLVVIMEKHLDSLEEPIYFEEISTGRFNTSYYISDANARYVLRIAPPADWGFIFYEENMMAREQEVHGLIRAQTDVPIPDILAFDTDRDLLDNPFLIMNRLPGDAATNVNMSQEMYDRMLGRVGEALAQVHAIHGPGYGYPPGGSRTPELMNDWTDTFFTLWWMMVDNNVKCGGYSEREGSMMKSVLEKHVSVFDRNAPPSLLHMDIWHQNILVDGDGNMTGIVDWDRAMWGDPEIEYAVLDYCGISKPAFWEGYGVERDLSPEAKIRNVFYLLYELQKYIVIHRTRRFDPPSADGYKAQVFRLVTPLL